MPFWRRKDAAQVAAAGDGTVELSGQWADGIWDGSPVRVPATLDVAAFLGRTPVPAIYPDDPGFLTYADTDEKMRGLWLMVLLHHPDPAVVSAALLSPHLRETTGVVVELADLLLDWRSPHEAAAVVWRMSDEAVHTVLNVVLDRGAVPGWHSPGAQRRALAELRTTCPEDRREFLEKDVAG